MKLARHYCGPPTPAALDLQVAEVVMSAPMSLALQWHDEHELRALFLRTCDVEDDLRMQGLCVGCGRLAARVLVPS